LCCSSHVIHVVDSIRGICLLFPTSRETSSSRIFPSRHSRDIVDEKSSPPCIVADPPSRENLTKGGDEVRVRCVLSRIKYVACIADVKPINLHLAPAHVVLMVHVGSEADKV